MGLTERGRGTADSAGHLVMAVGRCICCVFDCQRAARHDHNDHADKENPRVSTTWPTLRHEICDKAVFLFFATLFLSFVPADQTTTAAAALARRSTSGTNAP